MAVNGNIFTMKAVNDEKTSALFSQLGGLLGVSRGSDGKYHLADLCTAGSINKWAKNKPFRNSSDNFGYDPNNPSVGNAERKKQAQYANYGISIPQSTFGDALTMAKAVYNNTVVWEYEKPRGRELNEPFRLRDLDGYDHNAQTLLYAPEGDYTTTSQTTSASIAPLFQLAVSSDRQIALSDLRVNGVSADSTFDDMYVGMCCYNTSTQQAYTKISSNKFGEFLVGQQNNEIILSVDVVAPSSTGSSYQYMCFPFFCSQPNGTTFYPIPMAKQYITLKKTQQVVESMYTQVDAFVYQGTYTPLYYQARFTNNTQSVFNNLGLEYTWQIWAVDYDGIMFDRVAQGTLGRVEPYGSVYLPSLDRNEYGWEYDKYQRTQYLVCQIYYNGSLVNSIDVRRGYINPDAEHGYEPF